MDTFRRYFFTFLVIFITQMQIEGTSNGKSVWKNDYLDTYIYSAPNNNWHIYDKLGDGWGWMYSGGSDCPYKLNQSR